MKHLHPERAGSKAFISRIRQQKELPETQRWKCFWAYWPDSEDAARLIESGCTADSQKYDKNLG